MAFARIRSMLSRRWLVVVPLLLAATYGGAWALTGSAPFFGPDDCPQPTAAPGPSPAPSGAEATPPEEGDVRLSLAFSHAPDPLQANQPVAWSFTVTNVSQEAVTLTFSSGQSGDVVLSQGGAEAYRWSADQGFTQALRTEDLGPGESTSFTLDDTLTVEPGSYDLVATVTSRPAPSPAGLSVTVAGESSPSPSPPVTSPAESPAPSPTDPASPTPTDTQASGGGLFPATPLLMGMFGAALARHRRVRRSRSLSVFLAGVLLALAPAAAGAQEGGSGGKNVVIAVGESDGNTVSRSGVLVGHSSAPTSIPENLADARSACDDCRTVAVALQAVLVTNSPDVATPRNAAVAVNAGCSRCQTFAYAWQYVVSVGGAVRITPEGQAAIAGIRADAAELAESDLPFAELDGRLDAVAARFRIVIDTEVQEVGGRGVDDVAVDSAQTC